MTKKKCVFFVDDDSAILAGMKRMLRSLGKDLIFIVNSAFFGLYKHIDSPGHAVNLPGSGWTCGRSHLFPSPAGGIP